MSFSHVVNLVNRSQPVRTFSGSSFSILKKLWPSWRTRARLRVKCSRALRLCWKTFRSFFSLDQKHSIRVLWSSVIIPGLSLLLLPVVLFVVCLSIYFILMSLLLLSVLQNFIPQRIRLFQQVQTLKLLLRRPLTELVTSSTRFGKELSKG